MEVTRSIHYRKSLFLWRMCTSYLREANLTSLSLRWNSRFAFNRLISSAHLKFCPLISVLGDNILNSVTVLTSIHPWWKLKVSRKFCWTMFLKVKMVATGPLFLIFERLALKLGCFAQKSCHILLIDTLQSKTFCWFSHICSVME